MPVSRIAVFILPWILSLSDGFVVVTRLTSGSWRSVTSINRRRDSLAAFASLSTDAVESEIGDTKAEAATKSASKSGSAVLELPWLDVHESALRNFLPKYTVTIPLIQNEPNAVGKEDTSSTPMTSFALWRTMLKEVPELGGYPIDFLQARYRDDQTCSDEKDDELVDPPSLLPYLDEYEFCSHGGVSGLVYGISGLSDGSRIETSEVGNVEVTLTNGFLRTVDGTAAYEMGQPKQQTQQVEGYVGTATAAAEGTLQVAETMGSKLLSTVQNTAGDNNSRQQLADQDDMLVRLGSTTGILLAGATAVSMLSHHLTVNVFWV